MKLTNFTRSLLISALFTVYLLLGAGIFYAIEKDAEEPMDRTLAFMLKVASEKQLAGIQMGMTKAVPRVTEAYKGKPCTPHAFSDKHTHGLYNICKQRSQEKKIEKKKGRCRLNTRKVCNSFIFAPQFLERIRSLFQVVKLFHLGQNAAAKNCSKQRQFSTLHVFQGASSAPQFFAKERTRTYLCVHVPGNFLF